MVATSNSNNINKNSYGRTYNINNCHTAITIETRIITVIVIVIIIIIITMSQTISQQSYTNRTHQQFSTVQYTAQQCIPVCAPPPSLARLSIAAVSTMVFGTTFSTFMRSKRDITI